MSAKIIAPSILSADFSKLGAEVQAAEKAGADWIHVDVMDGVFVPNLTIGPVVVEAVRRSTKLPLDVHLMIVEPERYIEEFRKAGADSITFHFEASKDPEATLAAIRKLGAKAGISIKPATPVDKIVDILGELDLVLVMTVNPGFGGQSFMADCVPKISKLAEIRAKKGLKFLIEADGGIAEKTIHQVSQAGCDAFVAGSAVFREKDYAAAIAKLRKNL